MGFNTKYLLDANVFIEAKRRYYSFDICPGFWECLKVYNDNDQLCSIDRVKNELTSGGDDLAEWASNTIDPAFFHSTNQADTIAEYGNMVAWVFTQSQFKQEAKDEFANVADGWLIAYAKANDLILVTHEVANPGIKRKVPMPNVCEVFDVEYMNTFEMLSVLKTSFILET